MWSDLLPRDGATWVPVTSGESGAVVLHDAGRGRFAKLVRPEAAEELAGERDRTEWLRGVGLPGPSVLDWRVSGAGACLVTSQVAGRPADRLGPAALMECWPAIVDVVRARHDVPVQRCPFDRGLTTMMPLAREVVGEGRVQPDFLPQDLLDTPPATILERLQEELPLRLAQEQADAVVCHGDLTLPNVLVDPGTARVTGLVDLGRLGRADPYADLALLLATARETWGDDGDRRAAAVLGERYGIEPDPDRLRFHLWLDPLTW